MTQNFSSFLHRGFAIKRPNIRSLIIHRITSESDIWNLVIHVDAHITYSLVIAKQDVPFWHVALNHLGFKKQCIHLGIHSNPIRIGDFCYERFGFWVFFGVMKVLSYAIF